MKDLEKENEGLRKLNAKLVDQLTLALTQVASLTEKNMKLKRGKSE
jgi:hypothetical protein